MGQLGSPPASEAGVRRFDSGHPDQYYRARSSDQQGLQNPAAEGGTPVPCQKYGVIKEESGICFPCKRGDHERCNLVVSGYHKDAGAVFCSCQCTGSTLGAPPGTFKKVPLRIKKQFPRMEHDPLDNIL